MIEKLNHSSKKFLSNSDKGRLYNHQLISPKEDEVNIRYGYHDCLNKPKLVTSLIPNTVSISSKS